MQRHDYEKAAKLFFESNKREFEKFYSPTLIEQVTREMLQSLPTQVAARLAFDRLVANGTIKRTDGKTDADDRAEAVTLAQANLDQVVAEVDAEPLKPGELEYFGSLSQRELSRLYFGEDGSAVNEFAIRYAKSCREFGFVIPAKFGDQK
jgi:hypothetical protein